MSKTEPLNQTNAVSLPDTLLQMITGMLVSPAIYVAAKLGIADLLKDGAKSSEELAKSTQVDAQSLYRVLRALASVGIFAEVENRHFQLTPLAEYLQSDVPDSMQAIAIMLGEDWHWQLWGNILYSVKTGKPAFEYIFGMPIFQYLGQNPQAAKVFDACMTSLSIKDSAAISAGYNFSSIETLVDVGGGHGSLLAAILKANPNLKGILYDLPQVVAGAKQLDELHGRGQVVAGDFFELVPSGGDAYMMKYIIHDWDDERAITILKNCHCAMPETGKLLVVERLISPGNEPSPANFGDIAMLLMTNGGRERTEAEFRELFASAGFKLTHITPTQCPLYVIEGVKA